MNAQTLVTIIAIGTGVDVASGCDNGYEPLLKGPAVITEYDVINGNQVETARFEYTYDDAGKVVETAKYSLNASTNTMELMYLETMEYNSDSRLSTETYEYPGGKSLLLHSITQAEGALRDA